VQELFRRPALGRCAKAAPYGYLPAFAAGFFFEPFAVFFAIRTSLRTFAPAGIVILIRKPIRKVHAELAIHAFFSAKKFASLRPTRRVELAMPPANL
jgi:hypothetical protein